MSKQAADFWNERHRDPEGEAHDNFLSHPLIESYMSIRAFGSIVSQMETIQLEIRRRTRPGDTILSVGCGLAGKERWFAQKLPDRQFVAIDVANEIVGLAREQNRKEGVDNLSVEVGDFNALTLDADRFAIVLGVGAIHHVEELESFWKEVQHGLVPGSGCVIAAEYVGPSRFQWTDDQLVACDHALRELVPKEHKTHHHRCTRPDVQTMMKIDPSEAVRSDEIIPTAKDAGFDVYGFCSGGGALLQPVLWYQISTFDPRNWAHSMVLAQLFAEEDRLMREGVLKDDFAMFVAEPVGQRTP